MRSFLFLFVVLTLLAIVLFQMSPQHIADEPRSEVARASSRLKVTPPERSRLAERDVESENGESQSLSLQELHKANDEGFREAPGFGRHRGGTHVLMGDDQVRFVVDPVAATSESESKGSPDGFWGTLGIRLPSDDSSKLQGKGMLVHHNKSDKTLKADKTLRQWSERVIAEHSSGAWKLAFVQLVSLDRFDEPMAYVENKLPSMQAIADEEEKTRHLDEFEINAVVKLRSGDELLTDRGSRVLQMVGAIRASEQCIECHSVAKGDLLGAFTYHFDRLGDDKD